MIKKITVQNFFSFGNEQTIELNLDTNILVGINGSGKSNFIRILKLLQQGMNKGFEKLFSHQWGGFSSVSNLNDSSLNQIKLSFQLENEVSSVENNELAMYEISINSLGNSDYSLEECFKEEGAVGTKLVKSLKVTGKYKREIGDLVKQLTTSPSKLELLSDLKNINIYDYFNTSFTGDIRQLSPYYSETSLLADGRNLTSLLSYLNANSIKAFDKIVEELKNVNPNFKELVFATPLAGKTLLMLKEKNLDRAISVEFISDGTLRYLLLLAIFYNPNRGKIVCIDEPEAGLHPDMINGVAIIICVPC